MEYNWDLRVGKFPHVNSNHRIRQKSLCHEDQNPLDFFPMEAISSLNLKQRRIYDLFMGKYQYILHGMEYIDQLLINIDGEGGSGKSYLIKLLSSHLL